VISAECLDRLDAPVPPMLERALGYRGDALLVAFFRDEGQFAYSDGRITFCGTDGQGWQTFLRHPVVAATVQGYRLGSAREPARDWLLLDREQRSLYAGDHQDVEDILLAQWLDTSLADLDVARTVETLLQDLADSEGAAGPTERRPGPAEGSAGALRSWLDRQLQ